MLAVSWSVQLMMLIGCQELVDVLDIFTKQEMERSPQCDPHRPVSQNQRHEGMLDNESVSLQCFIIQWHLSCYECVSGTQTHNGQPIKSDTSDNKPWEFIQRLYFCWLSVSEITSSYAAMETRNEAYFVSQKKIIDKNNHKHRRSTNWIILVTPTFLTSPSRHDKLELQYLDMKSQIYC